MNTKRIAAWRSAWLTLLIMPPLAVGGHVGIRVTS